MQQKEAPEILNSKGISQDTVEALSSFKGEPECLAEKRLEAWQNFQDLPMPTLRDEAWRYTDISDVTIEDFLPYAASPDVTSESDLPDAVQRLIHEGEQNSALLVQHNSETAYGRVDEELPIQSYRWLDVIGSIMPRTLVVVEEGASVTYIDEYASADGEDPAFSNGAVELYVGQGANLRYVSLQNWERNVLHFNTIRSKTETDATINSLVVSFGSQLSRTNVEAGLSAAGSDSEMLGLYFADQNQVLDHHTLQDHLAPNAHSDLVYKGALRDESLAVFSGLIRVEPGAQKTDAYQTNRNLILGTDDAMAVSLPRLDHRPGGRCGALLSHEPRDPTPRGREARRVRFLRGGHEQNPPQGPERQARPGYREQDRARLRGAGGLTGWPSSTR